MPTHNKDWKKLGRLDLVEVSSQGLEERVSLYTRQKQKELQERGGEMLQ